MALRLIIVTLALLLAAGGFLGAGPTPGGPFNPFGWLFVGLAALVWLEWKPMQAGLDQRTGVMDAFTRNILGTRERKTSSGGSSS
ncbi:MAG TPA: hypothetical protein VME45_22450 [Stellaceae bacterium]|nr:hypothetical protein [Stellaceae bacterium]